MEADPVYCKDASSSFIRIDDALYNSVCQCCSLLKRDFQEIINIPKKELKYDSATKQDRMSDSASEGKPKTHVRTLKKLLHVSIYRSSSGSTCSSLLKLC
jgi:hypothetical protein